MAEAPAVLALSGLGRAVAGRAIVSPVSIELTLRGITVILGPNGAGKSTLLQLVHGMVPTSSGTATIRDGEGMGRPIRDGEIGFVLQRPVMLARTVKGNVVHALAIRKTPACERDARARAALAQVGLGDLADRPARRLSGGEQQRLAIARVIATSPACLLLDEPTAHLDPGATAAIERLLMSLSDSGLGLLMSTHDLGQARRLASTVVFMHRGVVVECAAASDFFDSPASESARRFLAGELLA